MKMTSLGNIGLEKNNINEVAQGLTFLLADTYSLFLKSQNFHWNVTGPRFHQLHEMFEASYTELFEAVDEIAERVRALGHRAPGSFSEFLSLTSISEEKEISSADQMIRKLIEGHELILRKSRELMAIASDVQDEATCDLVGARMRQHEKARWMLNSQLEAS